MGHDVYFESAGGELTGHYLKVNGCEKALANLIPSEETYSDVYNRSGKFLLSKESLLKFILDVRELDWKDKEIPDWVEHELTAIEQSVHNFDFDKDSLFIYTQ